MLKRVNFNRINKTFKFLFLAYILTLVLNLYFSTFIMRCLFKLIFFIKLNLCFIYVNGQVAENVRSSLSEDEQSIIIQYDLHAEVNNETFNIIPYVVFPDSTTRIFHVTGDVGKGITPGAGKRIEWDFNTEIDFFVGTVSFLITPEYVFPISDEHSKMKRGKLYNHELPDGFSRGYKLFLYNQKKNVEIDLPFHFYEDRLEITYPKKIRPGKYQLLLKSNSSEESIYTRPVKIKRKISLFTYALPVIAIGIYYAATTASDASRDLPEPPSLDEGFTK